MAYIKATFNRFTPDLKPEKVIKPKTAYKFKKKPTGEKDIFDKIWSEREHVSEINGEPLGEFNVFFFAHILPKGKNKYPHFKLREDNTCLMTIAQHHNWDNARHKCTGPEWNWLYEKEASLKDEYAILHPSK